jgi:glycosyltransferase involved in cell wall biosynthesis
MEFDLNSITLIVPAHNSELFLHETLQSLASQSLKEFEVIVIDDGSTDRTFKIAEEFAMRDSRFKIQQLESNFGESNALNFGWKLATGNLVSFISSDDPQNSNWLEQMILQIEKFPGYTHYYPDRMVINEFGKVVSVDSLYEWNRNILIGKMICIASAGTIINRECLPTSFLPRDENLIQCSDLQQMLELSKYGSGKRIKNVYGVWRLHSDNLSRSRNIDRKIAEFETLTSKWLTENSIFEESQKLYFHAKIYVFFQKLLWTKEQLGFWIGINQVRKKHYLYIEPMIDSTFRRNFTLSLSTLVLVFMRCFVSWFRRIPKKFTGHFK